MSERAPGGGVEDQLGAVGVLGVPYGDHAGEAGDLDVLAAVVFVRLLLRHRAPRPTR
ncbi:MAG: hypothetical protein ACRDOO_14490 [Actinomadura sp.]